MGSRLGVIVLTEHGAELYYDHWAAQTIGADIAIDGMEATWDRVRSMQPMGVASPSEWTGATWIEGSLLIDTVKRRVAWAEEGQYLHLPRLINHLIETTWPGWTAIWSPEGVRGILWLADVDPTTIFPTTHHIAQTSIDVSWCAPWAEDADEDEGAVSIRLDDGSLVAWRRDLLLDEVGEIGPDAVRSLAQEIQTRAASGEPVTWDDQPRACRPYQGLHVDFPSQSVRWWALGERETHIEAFDALWPQWSVETLGDGYEWHQRLLERRLRVWQEDLESMHRTIQRTLDEGPRTNPLMRFATLMAERGEKVAITASALSFQPASDFGGASDALAAIARLSGTNSIPSARYVNRHGRIVEADSLPG